MLKIDLVRDGVVVGTFEVPSAEYAAEWFRTGGRKAEANGITLRFVGFTDEEIAKVTQ